MFYKKLRYLYSKNIGAGNNRWDSPLFDKKWYANFYWLGEHDDPPAHFISYSKDLTHNPNALLDLRWYAETYMRGSQPTGPEVVDHYYTEGESRGFLPSEDFDPGFYAKTYPDARNYSHGLLAHYLRFGRVQKRLPFDLYGRKIHPLCDFLHRLDLDNIVRDDRISPYFANGEEIKSFFSSCRRFPEDVPLAFSPENYVRYNPDLEEFRDKPIEAIRHYLKHGFRENRLCAGFNANETESRFHSIWNVSEQQLLQYRPALKICVLVHVFYPDLYQEIKDYLGNLSEINYDIYFNLVENNWTSDLHKMVIADFPTARVIVSSNNGKDIGGYFNLLSYIRDIPAYASFLLLHTKKSPHIPEEVSTKWRKDLLGATIGTPLIVLQNAYLMEKFPNTGLIGSRFWRRNSIDSNNKMYYQLMKVLDISRKNYRCDYLSGTMMWLNARVMDYMYSRCKNLEFEDGNRKSLAFHKDGQLAHSMERAIGNSCQELSLDMNFR